MRTPDSFGKRSLSALLPLICLAFVLVGCAANAPPLTVAVSAPPKWYAPLPPAFGVTAPPSVVNIASSLPHNGSLTSLSQWWQQQNDPLLVELIDAAQEVSSSVITARSNIQQAQAQRTVSEAALLPTLDAAGGLSRSLPAPVNRTTRPAPVNAAQIGLQTNWEIDLFGQNEASLNADKERFLGTQARKL